MGSLLWFAHFLSTLFFLLHFQAPCSLSFSFNSSSSTLLCNHDQSFALLQFKKSFSVGSVPSTQNSPYHKPFLKTDSWKEGTDCCRWDGVTCDIETGNVIGLDLSSSLLQGTITSNTSLFSLFHLQKLDLSNNNFNNSQILPQFGQFLNLRYINLNRLKFVGQVPLEISHLYRLISRNLYGNSGLSLEAITFNKLAQNLTKLQELDLSFVDMSSVAPTSLMNLSSSLSSLKLVMCGLQGKFPDIVHLSELVALDLSFNDLTLESTYFYKIIQNLTKLQELGLSSINMSLIAPSSLMNLSSSFSSLKLMSCGLQGKVPDISHLSKLVSIDLSWNDGLFIEAMTFNKLVRNLTKLQELHLSSINMSLIAPSSLMNLSSSLSSLTLSFCGLRGKFPDNIIQPNLRVLYLLGNEDLTGSFPMSNWSRSLEYLDLSKTKIPVYLQHEFFNNLKSLRLLRLSSCNFVGSNLALFGNLTQLASLDLSFNNFSGQIPSSFANLNQLFSLNMESNNINGQIPSYFTNFTQLLYLSLSNNQLSGPIPSDVGRLSILLFLDLSNNLLNGTIPSSLFTLPLSHLFLNNNLLTGPIAGQFQNNTLRYLDLSHNKFYGSIPSSIFKLVDLMVLILSSNDKLTGQVCSAICELKSLLILDLSNNSLSGPIPICLGNFSYGLSVLHLGMNNFNGVIPETFLEDSDLGYLNFNGNKLQGRIPPSISNCKNLEILDLRNNKISTFPYFLGTLPELQILVLQSNKLHGLVEGNIEPSLQNVTNLESLDLSSSLLSGRIPMQLTDLTFLQIFRVQIINLKGPASSSTHLKTLHMMEI